MVSAALSADLVSPAGRSEAKLNQTETVIAYMMNEDVVVASVISIVTF